MASETPLTGVVLVDCARANAERGLAIATRQCGYGENTETFQSALQAACSEMGVNIHSLSELLETEQQQKSRQHGTVVAPETKDEL